MKVKKQWFYVDDSSFEKVVDTKRMFSALKRNGTTYTPSGIIYVAILTISVTIFY